MRQLLVVEFIALDGILEDTVAGLGLDAQRTTTAYLFGRRTYEQAASYWMAHPEDAGMAEHLAETPKYVISKSLSWPKWPNTQVLGGGVTAAVNSLKARGEGNVVVLGSAQLVRELVAENLVDAYRIYVSPVLLGAGRRLFDDVRTERDLRLVDCRPAGGGLVVLNYSAR
ncbi:MAG TPA: dihydrofolate reductase family protein [Candidatus Dormibacteraeota bacterium]